MDLDLPPMPRVCVVTAHGRQYLLAEPGERLIDVLNRHRIPWSGATILVSSDTTDEPSPGLDSRIEDCRSFDEIQIQFNRNVNPFLFNPDPLRVVEAEPAGEQATEYLYQRLDNELGRADVYLKKLSPEECREVVSARVSEMVKAHLPEGSNLVVGVSGGGDSNALLHALTRIEDFDFTISPVIAKGIPEWDAGVPRARELCDNYGLELTVIEEDELQTLLGLPEDVEPPLLERFEQAFAGDDFEFLGTLLVRLALSHHARARNTPYICTGLNLEDVLAECLCRIAKGARPAGIPARVIGETTLLFPLWLCPKRIIDGCFPHYSLENYDARFPCVSLGRNLYYSLVYAIQSSFPALTEQLAMGISELSATDPVNYSWDADLNLFVEGAVPDELRRRFHEMLTA